MGRRSDHTRDELKEMFIQAGRELVLQEGYQALNARGVAARIGYSVGTLYNIFNNLSDLVVHINARTLDGLLQRLKENSGELMAQTYLRYTQESAPLWRLIFEYQMPEGSSFPDWWIEKVNESFALIEEKIRPEFGGSEEELACAARLFWMGLHGISMLALSGRISATSNKPAEVLVQDLHNYLLAGHKALIQK